MNLIATLRRMFVISALGAIAMTGAALSTDRASASPSDEAEVAAAVEAFRAAMVRGDGEALTELASPDLQFGHSNGVIQSRDVFVGTVVDKKEIFRSIKLTNSSTKVVGDIAMQRHIFNADILLDGKPLVVSLGCLEIWHRQDDGRWLLTARQAFNTNAPMPPTNKIAAVAKSAAPVAAAARRNQRKATAAPTKRRTARKSTLRPPSKAVASLGAKRHSAARRTVRRAAAMPRPVPAPYPSNPGLVFPGDQPQSRQAQY